MQVDLTIDGSAARACRIALPDAPRLSAWIVEFPRELFVFSRRPTWHSQFAITMAPIDMLPSGSDNEGVTHRLAFGPLSQPYAWKGDDRPVVSGASLASVGFAAADDTMAGAVAHAVAGAVAAGFLPINGRHPRMAWQAAVGAVSIALTQARAEVRG